MPVNTALKGHAWTAALTATDFSNNQTQDSSAVTTQLFDNQAPVITNAASSPATIAAQGGLVTVSATVTDTGGNNLGVSSVILRVQEDGGNAGINPITLTNGGSGNVYTGTYTIGTSGNTVTHTWAAVITATDPSGNQSTNNKGNLVYQSNGPPNPVPVTTALTPNHVVQGKATDTTIVVSGSGFVPQSVVLVNGSAVVTTYGSNALLRFTLPASAAVSAGTYTVQVSSPALFGTDGGTSNSLPLTIDSVPVITNASISPPSIPSSGGDITVSAQVDAASGVSSVIAVVSINGVGYSTIGLSNGGAGDIYTQTFNPGANPDTAGRVFTAVIRATNTFTDGAAANATGQTTQAAVSYTDVTGSVSVTRSAVAHDAQGLYQILTITNISGNAIQGPIQVAITRLTTGVSVGNASGTLPDGTPYLTATVGSLAPGAFFQGRVNFTDPTNKRFSYGVRVYSGTF